MRLIFDPFCVDLKTRQLLRSGEERHLEPKAFELLVLLLSRRPEAISKSDIQERLWPHTFVSESSLTGLVTQIRKALGDNPQQARLLRTVHGFGYAFCGDVVEDVAAAAVSRAPKGSGPRRALAQIICDDTVFRLAEGDNILGRDVAANLCLDWPGISRRHARITVAGAEATLEDLGSKNGTFLAERQITTATLLADGDIFRIGRMVLEFRLTCSEISTRTEVGD